MKRRDFIKTTPLFLMFPKMFGSGQKVFKVSDFLDNTVHKNENLFYFKNEGVGKKFIENTLNGVHLLENKRGYYLADHKDGLEIKSEYTLDEILTFAKQCNKHLTDSAYAGIVEKKRTSIHLFKNNRTNKFHLQYEGVFKSDLK